MLFKEDDHEVLDISTDDQAATFLQQEFPNLYHLVPKSELAEFAARPPGKLPRFRYVGPDVHVDDKMVFLGDVIHTVKPYFGVGVNAALNDVQSLQTSLQSEQVSLYCHCVSPCFCLLTMWQSCRRLRPLPGQSCCLTHVLWTVFLHVCCQSVHPHLRSCHAGRP